MRSLPGESRERPSRARGWGRSTRIRRGFLLACLVGTATGPTPLRAIDAAGDAISNGVVHLGFSSSLFAGVKENDAKAALKVWAQAILREHGIGIIAEPKVYDGSDCECAARKARRHPGN